MKYRMLTLLLFSSLALQAQTSSDTSKAAIPLPRYLQLPDIPSFTIRLMDSSLFYKYKLPKDKSTVMVWFNPDCEHCIAEAKAITDSMHLFKNTQFVWASYAPFDTLKKFYNEMGLSRFPNFYLGRDEKYFLARFYQVRYTPFVAVYDRRGQIYKVFEGGSKLKNLVAACNQ
jgi:thiol-disulfide isomerase/thioredoxin